MTIVKYKRTVIFLAIVLMIIFCSISGFELRMNSSEPIYESLENKSFSEQKILGWTKKGEVLNSVGCYDLKTVFVFSVHSSKIGTGYLYNFEYSSNKKWTIGRKELNFFKKNPYESIQCLIMVPEFSR